MTKTSGTKYCRDKIPKHVSSYRDRHNILRWRYRKRGYSAELGKFFGSPEFLEKLANAENGIKSTQVASRLEKGTMAELIHKLKLDNDWLSLSKNTQRSYDTHYKYLEKKYGQKKVKNLRTIHIDAIIETKAKTPSAASNLRKRLFTLMNFAIRKEYMIHNPVSASKKITLNTKGHYSWTERDISQFFKTHSNGTNAQMAITIFLNTGAAITDATKLGPHSIVNNTLEYVRQKTEHNNGQIVSIPINAELRELIDNHDPQKQTVLETRYGEQKSPDGLGNDMRKWCDDAKLPQCTAHGLRKALCRRLADSGCRATEIMAISGHKTLSEVQKYIDAADRKKAAERASKKLLKAQKKAMKASKLDEPNKVVRQKNEQPTENKGE